MKQDGVLCQGHDEDGGRDGFAFQAVRRAFAIPAFVELAQAINNVVIEAQPLGYLAVSGKTGLDLR